MVQIQGVGSRPYRPGDWVQVDDAYGEVKSIGLRAMTMVTPDDTEVTIPHSKMWTSHLFNSNSGQRTQLCVADFYLHPKHDARRIRSKLRDVALTSTYLDVERPVSVVVGEKPWGTHYRFKAYPIDVRQQFQFTSDLTVRGKEALLGSTPNRRWWRRQRAEPRQLTKTKSHMIPTMTLLACLLGLDCLAAQSPEGEREPPVPN